MYHLLCCMDSYLKVLGNVAPDFLECDHYFKKKVFKAVLQAESSIVIEL